MPEMITGKKTQQYSTEFKVKAVEWSHQAHRSVKGVVQANQEVRFWDHETGESTVLAQSAGEFIAGCVAPSEVELEPGQVKSVWVDPEFAKKFGIDPKP